MPTGDQDEVETVPFGHQQAAWWPRWGGTSSTSSWSPAGNIVGALYLKL